MKKNYCKNILNSVCIYLSLLFMFTSCAKSGNGDNGEGVDDIDYIDYVVYLYDKGEDGALGYNWNKRYGLKFDTGEYVKFNDEADYSDLVMRMYVVSRVMDHQFEKYKYNDGYDPDKVFSILTLYSIPEINESVGSEIKEDILTEYYELRSSSVYFERESYGMKKYRVGDHFITIERGEEGRLFFR